MLTTEKCSFCKGAKKAERLLERRESGWYPNDTLDHGLADAWIKADKAAPLKWETCDCPSCHGRGSVEVEHVRCKIF